MILRAISLMILSMALLAGADAFFKLATLAAPIGQVMTLVGLGGTLLFIVMARALRVTVWSRDALHPMILLRNLFEVFGAIGMVVGLRYVPLPVFAAIIQTGPLVVTLGAALFLNEHVGWRRWAAVGVGIIGMMMVIRPFGAAFTGWELFAVMGITALSARDLVTRLSPGHIPALAISTWGFGSTLLPGLALWALTSEPSSFTGAALWPTLGAVVVTTSGYLAITSAMRMAPASIVAPFRYSRLVFTTGLGVLIFGDRPDFWTLAGSALILVAGLYTFVRERRLARAAEA
ncbi:DMT family transporter [Mameliella alba]|uniref:DMT family transporter n=1 Tax=Mameliella alba TaxID=561184 RepID=UPI000B52A361|nr:DMT family transporter [Mameliella alba]MBY6119324.1 DMT family transporter [Mameliella alba]OWV45031.1 transporter [Mameliella alba]OWV66681.1 transporter [Mameliella alba]